MENKEPGLKNNYAIEKLSRFCKILFLIALLPLTVMCLSLIPQNNNELKSGISELSDIIQYENFTYLTREAPLLINTITNDSICNISIYNNYFENIEITNVTPTPFKIISDNGNKTFSFLISKKGKQRFIFTTKPHREGNISGVISVDHNIFTFNQFVYSGHKLFN